MSRIEATHGLRPSRPKDAENPMETEDKILVFRHSAFNLIMLTENANGLRTLRFSEDGLRQSIVNRFDPEFLGLPYAKILVQGLAFAHEPKRLLILGLGGGNLPRFFQKVFPAMTIDVVEVDPDVLSVAREFCGLREDERLRVHVEDGRDFIERHQSEYDAVILDCFDAESVPEHLLTQEFLREVRASLSPGGIAIANVWGRNDNRLYEHMLLTYRSVFEQVYVLDVPDAGTKVFVAIAAHGQMTREQILGRIQAFPIQRTAADAPVRFRHSDLEKIENGSLLRD